MALTSAGWTGWLGLVASVELLVSPVSGGATVSLLTTAPVGLTAGLLFVCF